MPIYAYKCDTCGHEKDVLQKLSEAPLTQCPACGASTFRKQVTAAGFQLKGSGWYVTDFRDGGKAKPAGAPEAPASDAAPASSTTKAEPQGAAATPAASAAPAPAAAKAAPAPAGGSASTS